MPPNTKKICRQLATWRAASRGAVEKSAPSVPKVMIQPVSEGIFSGGNHCEKALKEAIRQAETPSPIRPRPMASPVIEWLVAKTAAPVAANSSSPALTRRAPKRSSSIPSGNWAAPNAMK